MTSAGGDFMDRGAAAQAVVQVWEAAGRGVETLEPGAAWVTTDGILVTVDATQTRISHCLRRGMPCTPLLLEAVAQLNQSAVGGSVLLVDDTITADDGLVRWAAVWAVCLPHAWTSPLHLQRTAYTCVVELVPHLGDLAEHMAAFGGCDEATSGLELWELTGLRQLGASATDGWPAGDYPTGHTGWARSAVEHDERDQNVDDLVHDVGSSFPTPLPIPIQASASDPGPGPSAMHRRAG